MNRADPVDEILASAVKGIPHHQRIFTVRRSFEEEHRIGIEVVVVGKRQRLPFGVHDFQHRLEMSGNAVADERHQITCDHGERDFFILFRGKPVIIRFSGHDLPVQHTGNGECSVFRLFRGKRKKGLAVFIQGIHVKTQGIADASV